MTLIQIRFHRIMQQECRVQKPWLVEHLRISLNRTGVTCSRLLAFLLFHPYFPDYFWAIYNSFDTINVVKLLVNLCINIINLSSVLHVRICMHDVMTRCSPLTSSLPISKFHEVLLSLRQLPTCYCLQTFKLKRKTNFRWNTFQQKKTANDVTSRQVRQVYLALNSRVIFVNSRSLRLFTERLSYFEKERCDWSDFDQPPSRRRENSSGLFYFKISSSDQDYCPLLKADFEAFFPSFSAIKDGSYSSSRSHCFIR